MRVKIISDSTCDLSLEQIAEHQIGIVPLIVMKGNQEFLDGITITPADIFAHVAAGGSLCTTAARGVAVYQEEFAKYAGEYDGVIHVNIGSGFSCCHQNARVAAEEFDNVYVVDSGNLSSGHGLVLLAASDAVRAGKSPAEILDLLENVTGRVEASFVLDRLDYMKKGGRCSAVTAIGANLLRLHPCIQVVDGKMAVVKKYRGSMEKVVEDYIRDRLTGREDIDFSRVVLTDACRTASLVETASRLLAEDGRFGEVIRAKAGCTIFCHCGPDTLGIMFLRK